MKKIPERSVVIVLFILTFIIFSLANEDARYSKQVSPNPAVEADLPAHREAGYQPAAERD